MATMNSAQDRDIDADATIKIDALRSAQRAALDLPAELDVHGTSALSSDLREALRRLTPPAPRASYDEAARPGRAMPILPEARRESTPPMAPGGGHASRSTSLAAASMVATIAALGVALSHLLAGARHRARSLGLTISQLAARCLTRERRERLVASLRAHYRYYYRVLGRSGDAFLARTSMAASRAWIRLWHSRRISRLARAWGPGDRT